MSGTAGDVIRIAKAEVGYHEGYSGGHWNNYQKYSPAVPGLEWSQNQAWCATFAAWCFQQAGMPKGSYPVTASCAVAAAWWKQQNRFSEYPAVGAQVFFGPGGGSHTGIVYAYDTDYIYTCEGNTNASGGAEGDGVYLKKRARRDTYVYGYGYPAYPAGIVTADPTWKTPATPSTEEDMTPEQAKQLTEIRNLVQYGTWGYKGKGKQDAWAILNNLNTQVTAQTAAIKALAGQLGKDVDTAQVVAAVEQAIKDAVVKVDVNVTGQNAS